ncbi:MAG: cellulase family glycosylhydrolase [Ignavibacteriaceae bacterium]
MVIKIFRLIILVYILTVFTGCSTFFTTESPQYVKVNGPQFILDGKPYYYMGTNLWYGCYLGSPGETGDRDRLIKELDFLKANGITNLRILAASEKSEIKNSLKPAIQNAPGVYDEDLLEGLDFLLSEMGKRNMHAVVFLNNYWEWSGGMSQYNAWFGDGTVVDPEVEGWESFMKASAAFYTNVKGNEHFREFIKKILTRKNKFNSLYYYEDPAVMAWQLANEPRPGSAEDVEYYYNWIDSTAMFIRSIDPNHLISTGNEGTWGSLDSEEFYITSHSSKYIDYLTFHLWPKNWGWFDANKIEETYPVTETNAAGYLYNHFELARKLNKPLVLEEFGIPRDSEYYHITSPVTARDKYFEKIFGIIYDSAAAGAPVAGCNFWAWGGFGRAKHDDYKWRKGDPFLGDPPQEPQGLNSVFDTDISTLQIIRTYAYKMMSLCETKSTAYNKLAK